MNDINLNNISTPKKLKRTLNEILQSIPITAKAQVNDAVNAKLSNTVLTLCFNSFMEMQEFFLDKIDTRVFNKGQPILVHKNGALPYSLIIKDIYPLGDWFDEPAYKSEEEAINALENGTLLLTHYYIALSAYQPAINETLETENKDVIRAINELNTKINNIEIPEISNPIEFGETEGTAYEGNKGKKNADDIKKIETKMYSIDSLLKGKNIATAFNSYSSITTAFNKYTNEVFRAGQNVYVKQLNVPDLWISKVYSLETQYVSYTYTTDEDFMSELAQKGFIRIGYYELSPLETQKVDLTEYQKSTDERLETGDKTIVGAINYVNAGLQNVTDELSAQYQKILSDELETESDLIVGAINELNSGKVGFNDIATNEKVGLVKGSVNKGTSIDADGTVVLMQASQHDINNKTGSFFKPITPYMLDYAFKSAITNCTETFTEEEQTSACNLLGSVKKIEVPEPDAGQTRGYVYFVTREGEIQLKKVQVQAMNGVEAIPVRDYYGNFYVGTPNTWQPYHCVNKQKLDEEVAKLQAQIDELKGV